MTASSILCGFAAVSFLLLVWQWLAARQFPLHKRVAHSTFTPPVTVLKPIKDADSTTAECLRSWFAQDYAGNVQLLLGVDSESDPACEVVRQLLVEFPECDAKVVICSESLGANPKVSKLIQMACLAKHDILVVSDADVYAPPDLLTNVVASFNDEGRGGCRSSAGEATARIATPAQASHSISTGQGQNHSRHDASSRLQGGARSHPVSGAKKIGLVNCFYTLANPATFAMRLEAVAVNVDFWSQVLQARTFGELDFALGAVICVRREALDQIGGFAALADYLADDYQLGNTIARAGWQIALCPVVVECCSAPLDWKAVWQHQVRWARTIRVCKPVPYFFSILSNATVWPMLWFVSNPQATTAALAGAIVLARVLTAFDLIRLLTRARPCSWLIWAVPFKDIFQVVVWLLAFAGNTIVWHGQRYRLVCGGKLVRRAQ